MLVQIYEVTSAEEASALTKLGVDHIGVLVGKGEFPREQSIEAAKRIFVGIPPSSKGSALCLSADLSVIELVVVNLRPAILHLGASSNLVRPEHVLQLKKKFERLCIARSIPVLDEENPFLSQRATTESQTCFSWIATDRVTRKSARWGYLTVGRSIEQSWSACVFR